jgi:hypothetical protein
MNYGPIISETSNGTTADANATVPEHPTTRAGGRPVFTPRPKMLEAQAVKPITRMRIWGSSLPWAVTRLVHDGHVVELNPIDRERMPSEFVSKRTFGGIAAECARQLDVLAVGWHRRDVEN